MSPLLVPPFVAGTRVGVLVALALLVLAIAVLLVVVERIDRPGTWFL